MKKIIGINWALSLCGLVSIDTECSSIMAVAVIYLWFTASSLILIISDKKLKNENDV
jgi:hypothetical protein